MNEILISFLRSLKEKDPVIFVLSNNVVQGNLIKYDESHDCVEVSVLSISGIHYSGNITLLIKFIVGWGK
jgi:hypothetical protein